MSILGVYLHIPFCHAICNYCNFNRGLLDGGVKRQYVDALVREIEASPLEGRAADTVYFGGGTPSVLTPEEVGRVLDACRTRFVLADTAEVTLEANPDSVTGDTLRGYRSAGVNRVSVGVQSFLDEELRRLSRLHTADRARTAYGEVRAAGFDNVSLDLMLWLPGQRPDDWLRSVDAAIALGPEHLSLYMLEVYPNAPLKEEMARSAWSQAPDDDVAEMYLDAMDRLARHGLEQYEIPNVARRGYRSRHNLKYWTDGDWAGFGCGAHATIDGVRSKNVSGIDEYIARVSRGASVIGEAHRLSRAERLGDALFTGLRLTDGVEVAEIDRRFESNIWQSYGKHLQPFIEDGLLDVSGGRWRLTRRGMLLAHDVMMVFV